MALTASVNSAGAIYCGRRDCGGALASEWHGKGFTDETFTVRGAWAPLRAEDMDPGPRLRLDGLYSRSTDKQGAYWRIPESRKERAKRGEQSVRMRRFAEPRKIAPGAAAEEAAEIARLSAPAPPEKAAELDRILAEAARSYGGMDKMMAAMDAKAAAWEASPEGKEARKAAWKAMVIERRKEGEGSIIPAVEPARWVLGPEGFEAVEPPKWVLGPDGVPIFQWEAAEPQLFQAASRWIYLDEMPIQIECPRCGRANGVDKPISSAVAY